MDFGKSFTFMFDDPNWIAKLAIGGAILLAGTLLSWVLLIPLLAASALLLGYVLLVTRNVADGRAMPLPEWNDFGALLTKGLYALVGSIVWLLPLWILICCITVVSIATGGFSSSDTGAAQTAGGAGGILVTCLGCLGGLIGLLLSIGLYAPLTRYALNDQINTFWDFRGNLAFMQANLGAYLIAFVLGVLVTDFLAGFGVILCGIGVFFTQFWAMLVAAHMFGQYARNTGTGLMPTPAAPPPMTPAAPAA